VGWATAGQSVVGWAEASEGAEEVPENLAPESVATAQELAVR
jgi:hypothetical protein